MNPESARISALRMQLLDLHPFWGYLLLQAELIVDPNLEALAATDGHRRIWFNPDRTCELSLSELGFVLLHEIGHHVQASFTRERGRNPLLWNCATDYAINRVVQSIRRNGQSVPMYAPPKGILLDKRFDGMVAESIYEQLLKDAAAQAGQAGQAGKPEESPSEDGDAPGGAPGAGKPGAGKPGVKVDGVSVADHGGGIDVHLPTALTPEERADLEDRMRAAVAHWEGSDQRGDAPGDAVREFSRVPTKVPWQRVLRRYVDAALTRDDLDPRRPNRRWLAEGAWVPGPSGERVGTIVVALDTSGSMSADALAASCAEIRALSMQVLDLQVVVADAKVHEVVDLDHLEKWLQRGRIRGGGGTSHVPVFEWVTRQGLRPDVFVGLTDLYSAFPAKAPGYPVLWVTPKFHGKAPFGRVIEAG